MAQIGDRYQHTVYLDSSDEDRLQEIIDSTGYSLSEVIGLAINFFYEQDKWPEDLNRSLLQDFRHKLLDRYNMTLEQWARHKAGVQPQLIYYVFRRVAQGGSVGGRSNSSTTVLVRMITEILGRPLEPRDATQGRRVGA